MNESTITNPDYSEFWAKRRAQQAKLEALSERDKKLLALARKISNSLGFALQNVGRAAEERYEREADDAMNEFVRTISGE